MTALQIIDEQILRYDDGGDRPQSPPAWMLSLRAEIERLHNWEYKIYLDPIFPGMWCCEHRMFNGHRVTSAYPQEALRDAMAMVAQEEDK